MGGGGAAAGGGGARIQAGDGRSVCGQCPAVSVAAAPAAAVSRINAQRLKRFAQHQLGLAAYLRDAGDGRQRPQIAAATIVWALLIGQIARRSSYHGVE